MKHPSRTINGVLLFDKPIGISSNRILQKVKHLFRAKKAGHTGTLDVLASGLLVICLGEATKFAQLLLDADKHYYVTAELGKRTTTCDSEGEVVETKPTDHVTANLLNKVLDKFKGAITQIPSMYSALKHNGKPLYELARQGIEVERKPRVIQIHELNLIEWHENNLTLDVKCSKGTYIRNLIDDIGQALDCGAYVTILRRLGSAPFNNIKMLTLEQLEILYEQGGAEALDATLLPIESMLTDLPDIYISPAEAQSLYLGKQVKISSPQQGIVRLFEKPQQFIGIGEIQENILKSKRLLVQQQD